MSPVRLDVALVEQGLVRSRNRAAREIAAGNVYVNGVPARRSSERIAQDDRLELRDEDPWVARSAHKLLGALEDFSRQADPPQSDGSPVTEDFSLSRDLAGAVCLDAGASTGGFTQVLLAAGAEHVFAVDVGHDQLDPLLAEDPRVTDLSGRNLRDLQPDWLTRGGPPEPVDLVCADVSFISLRLLIDGLVAVTRPGGVLLLMVKPQFELARSALDKHGVVTSAARRAEAVVAVGEAVVAAGARLRGWTPSRLPGPSGNQECFLLASRLESVGSRTVSPEEAALLDTARRRIIEEDS